MIRIQLSNGKWIRVIHQPDTERKLIEMMAESYKSQLYEHSVSEPPPPPSRPAWF